MSVDFDKIGNTLLEKQLVDRETLIKAAKVKEFEKKRSLAQILVDDYAIEHDTVFSEVASLYSGSMASYFALKLGSFKSLFLCSFQSIPVTSSSIDNHSFCSRRSLYQTSVLHLFFS